MRWHHSVTVINGGGATPDPVAAPTTVPPANCFRMLKRDPENDEPYRNFLIGLVAPTAESVALELYALDDDDDTGGDAPPLTAGARWYRVASIAALGGGRVLAYEPFKGGGSVTTPGRGGMFYLRVVSELVAANRVVRVGAGFGGGDAELALSDVNISQVGGTAVVTGGVAGLLGIAGNVAHDAVDAGNPVKVGFKAVQVLPADVSAALDRADGISDRKGRQYVRDGIAGDEVSSANRGAVNTTADDRDEDGAPQTWANESNTGAGTSYYPSTSGEPVANNARMGFEIQVTDATLYLQHSLTGGAGPWFDVTVMVRNNVNGGAGFPSFPSVGVSTNFNLSISGLDGGYFRWAVVYPDAGNSLVIKKAGKAN